MINIDAAPVMLLFANQLHLRGAPGSWESVFYMLPGDSGPPVRTLALNIRIRGVDPQTAFPSAPAKSTTTARGGGLVVALRARVESGPGTGHVMS